MTVTVNVNRQYPIVAIAQHGYASLVEASAITTNAMVLPPNSTVIEGRLALITDYDDDASETFTISVGVSTSVSEVAHFIAATTCDGEEGTSLLVVCPGDLYTAEEQVTITLNMSSGSSVLTAGASTLFLQYVVTGRGGLDQYE